MPIGHHWSAEIREKMKQRMLAPYSPSISSLSRETGIPLSTLFRWKSSAGSLGGAKESPVSRRPTDWSAAERFRVLLEAASLRDEELGAYLRREGLHEAQLIQWRADALRGLERLPVPPAVDARSAKKVRKLEKELRRKDKALAEAAALLMLQKKVRDLLEAEDDDTDKTNER